MPSRIRSVSSPCRDGETKNADSRPRKVRGNGMGSVRLRCWACRSESVTVKEVRAGLYLGRCRRCGQMSLGTRLATRAPIAYQGDVTPL